MYYTCMARHIVLGHSRVGVGYLGPKCEHKRSASESILDLAT